MFSWLKWLLAQLKAWFQVVMGVSDLESLQEHMDDPPISASLQAPVEDPPISVSLGPIDRLMRRLQSLVGSKHTLPKGISSSDIVVIGKHLKEFRNPLKNLSEMDAPSFRAKWWMKEVRELCYDTEDYLEEVMMQSDGGAYWSLWNLGRTATAFVYWIRSKLKCPRPKLSQFTDRATDLKEILPNCLHEENKDAIPPKKVQEADTYPQKELKAGVETLPSELVNQLAFDDDKQTQLKVVAISGSAGAGKTALASTVYVKYKRKFQCRAFVRVSRNPDFRSILTSILSQFKAAPSHDFPDVQGLIVSINKHLQRKRYFVVIDDIRSPSVWDIISRAFPGGDFNSRIIVTTQSEQVEAAYSGYELDYAIFKIGTHNDGCKDTFIYNNLPHHLKTCLLYFSMYTEGCTVTKDDLVKQWVAEGFIAALKLKRHHREESSQIPHNKIEEISEAPQDQAEEIEVVPQDENGEITKVPQKEMEKIAEGYFDELLTRGMIQPVDRNHKGDVLSCTVHHMVLDLIRYKSKEENFIVVVDNLESTVGHPDIIRRLSIQFGSAKGANMPESIILSQVRSLAFYGFLGCVPSIAEYGRLRVLILNIWVDEDSIFDLTTIGELYHLRYVKAECNVTVRLPSKMQRLQHLGTLQLDARLCQVPSDIVHLEKLLHLRLPSESTLPHRVGRMTSLRTLGYFDLGTNSEDNVRGLDELKNLQDLQLTCSTGEPAERLEKNMQLLLGSVLQKLSTLRSVTLAPASGSCKGNTPLDYAAVSSMSISCDGFSSVSPAPAHHLQRLELSRHCCIFSRVPKWLGELAQLCILKIAVRELSKEGIDILKGLRPLTALSLHVATTSVEMIVFGKGGFSVLTYFKFTCTVPWLKFEAGAMPNLHTLKLCFNATTGHEQGGTAPIIIEHLSSGLQEISAKICCARGVDARSALSKAISNDPSNPEVQLMCSIYDGGKGRGLVTREESGEDENNEAHSRIHMLPESSRLLVPDVSPPSGDQAAPISQEKGGSVRLQLFALPWTVNKETAPDDSSRQHRTAADESSWPPALPLMVRFWLGVLDFVFFLSQRSDGTVRRWFFSLGDWQTPARPGPDARGVRSADVIVDASRKLWLRVYYTVVDAARRSTPLPVVVYFHGGGFALLSAASTTVDDMCRRFCRELGAVVVSVNYRLAPEHRYPAAYDDCVDVLHYLSSTGLPGGISVPVDLSRCFLAGNGAGGNIAHHVAQRWTNSPPSNSPVHLAGIILLQPYFGGEERTKAELELEGVVPLLNMRRTDWAWRAFLPEGADRNHPAAHVTGEAGPDPELAEAFPPAMVAVGGMDPLQDWQWRYIYMLQRKGKAVRVKKFPDAIHAFYCFPELPDSARLLEEIKAFIESNASIHHSAA